MRKKIDLLILLLVLVAGAIAVMHAQTIGDWWHGLRYDPPAEVSQLADDAGMSSIGAGLFYRFEPQIVDQTTLDGVCNTEKLGCTEGRSIYILQSADEREYDRNIVTAAHEMLHVAYSRMSTQERDEFRPLMDAELKRPDAANIVKALNGYPPADYYNEAHSFIGSQLPGLDTQMEDHFSRYFSDRTKTTDAYSASR